MLLGSDRWCYEYKHNGKQITELKQLKEEVKERSTYVHVKIVHNDFMTFASKKHYDLILMNPPFANGDEHLMKAIQMQQENGGKILCILNAETLLNLYSNKRIFLIILICTNI